MDNEPIVAKSRTSIHGNINYGATQDMASDQLTLDQFEIRKKTTRVETDYDTGLHL